MCGIYFSLARGTAALKPNDVLTQRLKCRGPDASGVRNSVLCFPGYGWISTHIEGTVLALRGSGIVSQPITAGSSDFGDNDFLLCWNGEVWTIDNQPVNGSDTELVARLMFQMLSMCSRSKSGSYDGHHIVEVLARIRGPYSFVVLNTRNHKAYFARDCLGRRSLLFKTTADAFLLSSVGDGTVGWTEVETNKLYILDWNPAQIGSKWDPQPVERENTVVASVRSSGLSVGVRIIEFPWARDIFTLEQTLPHTPIIPLTLESASVRYLLDALRNSLRLRLTLISPPDSFDRANTSSLAILFSGGLDCTILARLAHELLSLDEPIDLLNVAFQNPRIHGESPSAGDVTPYESCPDRITARRSLSELQSVCTRRSFRLVAINVPFTETQSHRNVVLSLMQPHDTEMDLSIALALYFAARGIGIVDDIAYTTPARVLLSGLGADEIFGGYRRHATAFERGGLEALITELALDVGRLGQRNLGRDDRVIAHWGREARYPYLDEALLQWAATKSVWEKCGFGQGIRETRRAGEAADEHVHDRTNGWLEPGKLILRLLADKLGMHQVAAEKKRAIQFGARTAKMEKRRTKGTDVVGNSEP